MSKTRDGRNKRLLNLVINTLSEASKSHENSSNRIQVEKKLAFKLAEEKLKLEADLIQEREKKIQKHQKKVCKDKLNINSFLLTEAVPNLYWLPKVPNESDIEQIKRQQNETINKYQSYLVD